MGRASATDSFAVSVDDAEARWYDTGRWPAWIDGLARVTEVTGDWPRAGSAVAWESTPRGRGRVLERVVTYEPRRGQTLEVADASIRGRQSVSFDEQGLGVVVELALDYELKDRSIVTPVLDRLFIRRAMTRSLQLTLERFGVELVGA